MRFNGKLAKWNEERGFGFIAPDQGGQELFVHVSAFPRDGRMPRVDEPMSFEVEHTPDGKKRAAKVQRPQAAVSHGQRASHPPARRPTPQRRKGPSVIALLMVCAIGAFGYQQYQSRVSRIESGPSAEGRSSTPMLEVAAPAPSFECRGRQYCSQMTSCTEAKWVLKNCPDVKMDGNHDGVPCEQQWCTSPLSK